MTFTLVKPPRQQRISRNYGFQVHNLETILAEGERVSSIGFAKHWPQGTGAGFSVIRAPL
jgi:hypothetical protein